MFEKVLRLFLIYILCNMIRWINFILLSLSIPFFANSQTSEDVITISGMVFNKETTQPLQYVAVEIEGKNIGVLTDKTGLFLLDINKTVSTDSLSLRILGYELKKISIKDILLKNDNSIFLTPLTFTLPEVTVSVDKNMPKIMLGINSKRNSVFFMRVGNQLAVFCENKNQSIDGRISKVRFYLGREGEHQTPFRIHVYSVNLKDTTPGNELLNENLIVFSDKRKWFEIDIEKYKINVPPEGFFVSMEWIYTDDSYFFMDEPARKKYRSKQYGQTLGAIQSSEFGNITYIKSLGGEWVKFINPFLQKENKSINALIGAQVTIYSE